MGRLDPIFFYEIFENKNECCFTGFLG